MPSALPFSSSPPSIASESSSSGSGGGGSSGGGGGEGISTVRSHVYYWLPSFDRGHKALMPSITRWLHGGPESSGGRRSSVIQRLSQLSASRAPTLDHLKGVFAAHLMPY